MSERMPGRSSTAGGGRQISSHLEAWTKSVAKALAHPTRMGILERMEKVGQTSPSEAADGGSASLPAVAYHMRELKAAGLIKATMTRPARGAVEHFYELTDRGHAAVKAIDKVLDLAPRPSASGSKRGGGRRTRRR
jgi:DNA-binding transcriptional ArsR family regulator